MRLTTSVRVEEKYDSPALVVAPGGWCCCCCCHCWCHCHVSAVMADQDNEEI